MEDEAYIHPDEQADDETEKNTGKSTSVDALHPVTLCQVSEATQPYTGSAVPWYINGRQVRNILIVASVIEEFYKPDTCTARYRLTDSTNAKPILAFRSIEPDNFQAILPPPPLDGVVLIPQHRYVRIMGVLTAPRGNANAIRVYSFHVVTDPHEPYTHKLQVFAMNLELKRGPPPPEVLQSLPDTVKIATQSSPPRTEKPAVTPKKVPFQSQSQPIQTPPATPRKPIPATPGFRPTQLPTPSSSRCPADNDVDGPVYNFGNDTLPLKPSRPAQQLPTPSLPSPATPTRLDKGKGREREKEWETHRLSTKDPLSDLSPLQRNILLKIMEGSVADPEEGLCVVDLAKSLRMEEVAEDGDAISEALDTLLDKGHITTDEDGMMYKAISKQGRMTYTFVSDD